MKKETKIKDKQKEKVAIKGTNRGNNIKNT